MKKEQPKISAKEKKEQFLKAEALLKTLEEKQNFRLIYDSFYQNKNLDANEIALLFVLITNAPTFKPNYEYLMKRLKIGEIKLIKASKGLQEKGYLKIVNKGKNNKEWIVSQKPILNIDNLKGAPIEPNQIKKLLDNGLMSKEQAKANIQKYLVNIFNEYRNGQTDEELLEIIKTKWL